MPALDIFSSSAFSMVALTDAINKMPYVPGRIGQLGLFREQGVSTTSVMIEEREGSLNLVETTARGAPAIQGTTNKREGMRACPLISGMDIGHDGVYDQSSGPYNRSSLTADQTGCSGAIGCCCPLHRSRSYNLLPPTALDPRPRGGWCCSRPSASWRGC